MKKPLPIGVENFKDMVTSGYYYVDKTMFIKELLDLKGKVNLFTRPRRFGKTLNLSMLRYFFEDTGDTDRNKVNQELFSGLAISKAGEQYTREMGQYPVIMVTLKSVRQNTCDKAIACLKETLTEEFARHEKYISGKLESQAD